jgi:tRNA modification GTPase
LINALAGRDVAITSEIAGTTRDVIEVRMDLEGIAVTLMDTAGLRSSEDVVERIGIERARDRANKADLRIFLRGGEGDSIGVVPKDGDIEIRGKADLELDQAGGVSGLTGAGIPELKEAMLAELRQRSAASGVLNRERHRLCLVSAISSLDRVESAVRLDSAQLEVVAEDLRQAASALASLLGSVDVESVLGEIFSRFCIGK